MNDDAATPETPVTPPPPDNAAEKPAERAPSPREEAMAAIERQNNERIAAELGLKPEDFDVDADPDDAAAEAERQRLEREAQAAEAQVDKQVAGVAPAAKADDKPKLEPTVLEQFDNIMVKTKVDGQEVTRPLADLVRVAQKDAAATQRLQQATQLRDEAERLLASARKEPQGDGKTPSSAPAGDAPLGKELLDAIYSGEEDKALAAFNQLFGNKGRDAATPDPNAIAKQVKQQLDTEAAMETFSGQYPEIVADPYLADVADRFLAAELQLGASFNEGLKKAGDATRDWLKQRAGSLQAPSPPASREEKRSRKESIDVIPSIHATATTSREPAQPSVSEVLEEMRKARGLAY